MQTSTAKPTVRHLTTMYPSNPPSHINPDYLLATPSAPYKATIFLIHGWPDLSIGWRYQIPPLLSAGYRVVCPDIMGFGRTAAPHVPPESIENYSFKRAAADIKALAKKLGLERIILGGHDWGGAIVYRVALWYPELVSHMFAVCTPYHAPAKTSVPLEVIVKAKLPNFGYQIQLASGEVEKIIRSKKQIKQFLSAMYGGKGPNGEVGFDVKKGVVFENLERVGRSRLMSEEMLEFYAEEYARTGLHSTLCWYRNREQNFQDELQLDRKIIDIPVLFIQATKDDALPPSMSKGMEEYCLNMTRKSVATSHWALWEAPEQVNGMIGEWLERSHNDKSKSNL